jgi:hypothetical protein
MTDFRHVVEIRASALHVWAVLLDVERWPEWTTSVTKVQRMDIGPLTLGSRTRIWQPRLRPAVWQVTSLDEQRLVFAWTTRSPGIRIIGLHYVEPLKSTSRVTLSLQYQGPLSPIVARFYANLSRDYLAREANDLRQRCETSAEAPPAQPHLRTSAQ